MLTRPAHLQYALITPAWNEEQHLEQLIQSVTNQTILPIRWVIVSDGSTDRTDEIIRSASLRFPWIVLLRLERDPDRHFAGIGLNEPIEHSDSSRFPSAVRAE